MAWSLIAHAAAGGGGGAATTAGVDTTGSDLIIIVAAYYGAVGVGTISDNKGNTWTPRTAVVGNGSTGVKIYYCQSPTVGSGHTFSQAANTVGYPSLAVLAFSGSVATPYDTENGSGGATGTSHQSGSITPAATGELLILGAAFGAGNTSATPTADSGFSAAIDYHQGGSGVDFGVVDFWLSDGNANAINPTVSWSGAADNAVTIAAFKAAGGATFNPGWATGATRTIGGVF